MKRIGLALYVLGTLATIATFTLWFIAIWSYGHEHATRYGGSGALCLVVTLVSLGSGWLLRNQ